MSSVSQVIRWVKLGSGYAVWFIWTGTEKTGPKGACPLMPIVYRSEPDVSANFMVSLPGQEAGRTHRWTKLGAPILTPPPKFAP